MAQVTPKTPSRKSFPKSPVSIYTGREISGNVDRLPEFCFREVREISGTKQRLAALHLLAARIAATIGAVLPRV